MPTAANHEKRFSTWSNLGGSSMRALVNLVEEQLVPAYLAVGFGRTSVYMNDPTDRVSGREIHLERQGTGEVQFVTFNFDKYRRPAFQVHIGCRSTTSDRAWIRSANVVKRRGQLPHFWGKPRWLPMQLWTEGMSSRVIDQLAAKTAEVLVFLGGGHPTASLSTS